MSSRSYRHIMLTGIASLRRWDILLHPMWKILLRQFFDICQLSPGISKLRPVISTCGVWHTAAVVEIMVGNPSSSNCSSGKAFTWRDGDKGRLGHGDKEAKPVPTCVAALIDPNFCQVACEHSLTVALTTSGHVYTIGRPMHHKGESCNTVQPVLNTMSRHPFSMSRCQSNGAEPKAFCQSIPCPHLMPIHQSSYIHNHISCPFISLSLHSSLLIKHITHLLAIITIVMLVITPRISTSHSADKLIPSHHHFPTPTKSYLSLS